mgnify:CR=1 FL=1
MSLAGSNSLEIIKEALRLTVSEVTNLIPKILVSVIIVSIFFLVALILNKIVKKVLDIMKIDDLVKQFIKQQIPVNYVIIALLNVGIALTALYSITVTVFPEFLEVVTLAIDYVSRVASVAFLVVFIFIVINMIIERIRIERGLRGFMMILTFLLVTMFIIDITSLSSEVKSAITWGLSLGIGISIGVFTIWYFFGEVLKKRE